MNGFDRRAGLGQRWFCTVYVACLLSLVALGGRAWRERRFERRGIERARQAVVERRPGINVALERYRPDELEHVLDDVRALGFYWLRQRFPWREIESQPGVYDWAQWDAVVDAARARDLGLIAVLDDPPGWALRHDEYPLPCVPPANVDAYAQYVSEFALRYGAAIDHYQVWDEPNLSRSWGGGHVAPCGYAVLLEVAYGAVHAADPKARVLGGSLAPTQAPGPDDLNDLLYLRQLYAVGGGEYFDILAVKPYGFWSGPGDRRIASDVLNYSRVIAARELVRVRGDGKVPVWAVEWGWNVLPDGWAGGVPPWGTDTIATQEPRIVEAMARARAEWPWMGVMCWAEYQPNLPTDDPRWGFAVRDIDGGRTPLYDSLRIASITPSAMAARRPLLSGREWAILAIFAVACAVSAALWRRLACGAVAGRLWRWWASRRPICHLAALIALGILYALTPWPEWVVMELALAAALLTLHPRWALIGAVCGIPFFYATKPVCGLELAPSETLLFLAVFVVGVRSIRDRGWQAWPRVRSWLDAAWLLWVTWGAVSLVNAPDLPLAWHEWRLSVLGPALLYLLLRLECVASPAAATYPWDKAFIPESQPRSNGVAGMSIWTLILWPALAWLLCGVAVAGVGIYQWLAGTLIPAGGVGRVTGVYYSPNHLALYLGRVWAVALALALGAGLKKTWRRWAWGAVIVLGIALYLSYSRGAWLLAVPAVLFTVGWCYRKRLRWWVVAGGVVAVALAASNVFYGRLGHSPTLDEVRIPVWQSTLRMIADHPWVGVGLDGFRFVYPRYMRVQAWTEPLLYHPHNMWLDAAARLGLPGLALFITLIALCLRETIRWVRGATGLQRALAVGCLASLLGGLAHGLVDSGYFLPDLAWSLALVAGMSRCRVADAG